MQTRIILAAISVALATGPALAQKPRHPAPARCVDAAKPFSLMDMIFSTGPAPQANGCAPAVYDGGRFVGQDPDPNIRLQLRRDSDNEGYHLNQK
ncbi:MAG TPA: hypothetical protein VHD59_04210 [Pseudolabrys sp.]|jgi:hypothetical protein|nr:hypothetical protein [Pseudolabrys sp.]